MTTRPESLLPELVATGIIDGELAALVWLLAEHGVPLVVASADRASAERTRRAFTGQVLHEQPSRDIVAGGVVLGSSLEDVLRMLGADLSDPSAGVPDETRDLGVVVVVDDGRVRAAHYVRQLERDGAGHVQRRPPALLSAWNAEHEELDHFYWAVTDELATRAGMTRAEFEDEHALRRRRLADSTPGPKDARH